jgi:hypothetical protein
MKLQFVSWFPEWVWFRLIKDEGGLKHIYDWRLSFMFWEIRKWRGGWNNAGKARRIDKRKPH